jgi:hypothetical protein
MILMKNGLPMIIIPNIKRRDYISSLSSYKTRDDFILFMADIINENIKDYMRMINPN